MASATIFIPITPKFPSLAQTSFSESSTVSIYFPPSVPQDLHLNFSSSLPSKSTSPTFFTSVAGSILHSLLFSVLPSLLQFLLLPQLPLLSTYLSPPSLPLRPRLYHFSSGLLKHSRNWLPCTESCSLPSSILHRAKTQKSCSDRRISSSHPCA